MGKDVKEIMELLKSIEILAVAGATIAKDGKLYTDDLKVIFDLLKHHKELQDGFKDLQDLSSELKDLDGSEIEKIVVEVFSTLNKVKNTLK